MGRRGYGSNLTVRVPTPEEAIARARDLIDEGGKDVSMAISATNEVFTADEFEKRVLPRKKIDSDLVAAAYRTVAKQS